MSLPHDQVPMDLSTGVLPSWTGQSLERLLASLTTSHTMSQAGRYAFPAWCPQIHPGPVGLRAVPPASLGFQSLRRTGHSSRDHFWFTTQGAALPD